MIVRNALLKSVDVSADLTSVRVTLHFDYGDDGTQKAGPLTLTEELLRAIADVTDERSIISVKDKPCRVQVEEFNDDIVAFAHFLRNDQWFSLTQPTPRT